jgi:hypothetical protein
LPVRFERPPVLKTRGIVLGEYDRYRRRVELRNPFQGARLERRRIVRDRRLSDASRLGDPSVECRNQFLQFADGWRAYHRHRRPPGCWFRDRDTFHTSPHFVHRQYVSASGFFAVVTIDDEPQAGQSTGIVPAATGATGIEF